jgi:hypothetical protein
MAYKLRLFFTTLVLLVAYVAIYAVSAAATYGLCVFFDSAILGGLCATAILCGGFCGANNI